MYAPVLNYAQLRPKGVESNHFAYHLEQLVKSGLVAKHERKYTLTSEGIALADRVSHDDMNVRKQPHIVTTLYITNDAGRVLLYKHAFQPYLELYGFPQGRLHYGETVSVAAGRELFEKTGIQNAAIEHRGMAYIHTTKDGVEISQLLAHVFTGSITGSPELAPATKKGAATWEAIDAIDASSFMPGFWEIKKLADNATSLFFAEIKTDITQP